MSLSHEPTEVGSEDEPEVVGEVSWPRLEVLSWLIEVSCCCVIAGGGRGLTVMISKSCMKSGFEPAKRHSIDSTKAASAQSKGTKTENRIVGQNLSSTRGDVCLVRAERGGLRSQIIYKHQQQQSSKKYTTESNCAN